MANEIAIISESDLKSKIFIIRGVQVMLDIDLAEIYGYETKRFNEQVKNNIERFDDDFRFQLTDAEVKDLWSKISTTNISLMSRSLPYAFTEQGIYMLMTVLRGNLAVAELQAKMREIKSAQSIKSKTLRLFINL